jgi:sulfur-oxidizing protein SoxY
VVGAVLGPRAGRATLSTRVRLADTQTVTAIAQLSDGSFWSDTAEVVVTLSACLEEGLI